MIVLQILALTELLVKMKSMDLPVFVLKDILGHYVMFRFPYVQILLVLIMEHALMRLQDQQYHQALDLSAQVVQFYHHNVFVLQNLLGSSVNFFHPVILTLALMEDLVKILVVDYTLVYVLHYILMTIVHILLILVSLSSVRIMEHV